MRRRPTWSELPPAVRAAVEERLGATVRSASSHDGGYSPGLASTLTTTGGPVFVKAVPVSEEFSARVYRQEVERSRLLPDGVPAPRARWVLDVPADDVPADDVPADDGRASGSDGAWVVVAFDAVAGRAPATPLVGPELDAVAGLARRIGGVEVAPGVLPELADELPHTCTAALSDARPQGLDTYDPWFVEHLDDLAAREEHAADAARGRALVHGDLRADNALLVGPEHYLHAVAVDWPYVSRGAAFFDLVAMLPAVQAEGGPTPEDVLARHPLPAGTDDDAVTAVLVALTGYFVAMSLEPDPPGIPHVRAFQRAQGEAGLAWLRRRLGT
ncbi:hypothetical protein ATJ88_1319 [Isoptericola jiangsuensis]|uniref:Uncharacterized protein n=1 Tax=Isoptericola jiangsuensis TaxID=548579 RepID=A0A2A9EVW2_9MICO|nr:phosphotransferase [Isoptericola jiangsuensis]PFG42651.1 hypothetical protein ATJ88_1319 [Isoptericola jiangsuensis]